MSNAEGDSPGRLEERSEGRSRLPFEVFAKARMRNPD
jgi:hypothetical protein